MVSCAIGLLIGIGAFQLAPSWAYGVSLVLGLGCVFGLICCVRKRLRGPRSILLTLFGAAAGGALWAAIFAYAQLSHDVPVTMAGALVSASGIVASLPEQTPDGVRFDWQPDNPEVFSGARLLRLSWYARDADPVPGDRWRFSVKLSPRHGLVNPSGFDYESWLFRNGYAGTGIVVGHDAKRLDAGPRFRQLFAYWRFKLGQLLRDSIGDNAMYGIIRSLAIGDRQALTDEQWAAFLKTGTNHLIAISGVHITMLAGLGLWVGRRLMRYVPERRRRGYTAQQAGAVLGLLLATVYSGLAGFSVPTERTLIMLAVFLGATLFRRAVQPSRVLALALMLVLLSDPLAVLDLSFWLSFIAVAILLLAFGSRPLFRPSWRDAWRSQFTITLGLMPCTLLFVSSLSWVSPLANLLAVPVISFIVAPLAVAGVLVLPLIPQLGTFFATMAAGVMHLLWWVLQGMSNWPLAQWDFPALSAVGVVAIALGMALIALPRGFPGRWLAPAFLLVPLLAKTDVIPPGTAELTVLDVGQGLGSVVRTQHHTLVFDTGSGAFADATHGDGILVPYLRAKAASHVDTVVISHGDMDHRGGFAGLVQSVAVDRVLSSEPDMLAPTPAQRCVAGDSWQWDGVDFSVLYPPRDLPFDRNDLSCVLRITAGEHSFLLTGDIEARAEAVLAYYYGTKLHSDVLVVPHHGSATSSSAKLLNAVQPRWALIPVGYLNRYGHPKPDVIARYQEHGIKVLRTDYDGAIQMRFSPQGISNPISFRAAKQKYWTLNLR